MAYEPGTYTRELIQRHADGEHADELDDNCPGCRVERALKEDPDATHESILGLALDMEEAIATHARHGFGNTSGNCPTCAIEVDRNL